MILEAHMGEVKYKEKIVMGLQDRAMGISRELNITEGIIRWKTL